MKNARYSQDVGRINKVGAVEQWGIGEDLPPTLFGWVDDDLRMVCTISTQLSKARRFEAMLMCVVALRRGFEATSITILHDGYFSAVESDTDIVVRYAQGDQDVTETLLSIYVGAEESFMLFQPYQVGLGRVVEFIAPPFERKDLDPEVAYVTGIRQALTAPRGSPIDVDDLAAIGVTIEMLE